MVTDMTLSCPPRRALGLTLAITFAAALAGCSLEAPAPGGSDDALRAGDTTLNVWDRLLGSRYQVTGDRTTGGDGPGFTRYGYGAATEKATGKSVYIAITPEIDNGTAHPVVVIAPSQSDLQRALPDEKAVAALQRYNFMPLECQSIGGDWTSSFTSAAETYSATGS